MVLELALVELGEALHKFFMENNVRVGSVFLNLDLKSDDKAAELLYLGE